MKRTLLFLLLLLLAYALFSQSYFISKRNVVCFYNQKTKAYDICGDIQNEDCIFKIPNDEVYISFTNQEGTSVYYVMDRVVKDSQFWFSVRYNSEIKHIVVVDIPNKEIRVFIYDSENSAIIYYLIDDMWTSD
jgi:hypothetical protein